jgi:hypothetical protein
MKGAGHGTHDRLHASMPYTETATAHMHTMTVAVFDGTAETWLLNDRRRLVRPI